MKRTARIGFVCCLVLGGAPVAGCGSRTSSGEDPCTALPCGDAIAASFPLDVVGARKGAVHARICLDGTCRDARGVLDPHEGPYGGTLGTSFGEHGIEVRAMTSEIYVSLRGLPGGRPEETTGHRVVAELEIDGRPAVVVERKVDFRRYEPNGPDCAPTCWAARVTARAGDRTASKV